MQSEISPHETLIIVTSDEPWSNVWHTQLHYAYELSKQFTVIYVEPPDKWNFSNLFRFKPETKKISDSLTVLKYHNAFPITFLKRFFIRCNDYINSFLVNRIISHEKTKIILWRFDHFRCLSLPRIKIFRSIYHVVDYYIGQENNVELTKQSDLVIITSPRLLDYYFKLNQNAINIPQSIGRDEFLVDKNKVEVIKNQFGKIILFISTLTENFSFELIKLISDKFADHTMLIIGPYKLTEAKDIEKFEKLKVKGNVKYIGVVNGPELKNYVKASEVCLIPYKFMDEKKINIRSPLKAINYIAQKKIVITTIDCEIKELENKIIYKADTIEEFVALVQKAIDKKITVDEKATENFLGKISYDNVIDFIFSKLK
jgi:hypothetical protein